MYETAARHERKVRVGEENERHGMNPIRERIEHKEGDVYDYELTR